MQPSDDNDDVATSDPKKLLMRIRDRWEDMKEADRDNRQKALDDLRFLHVPGEQWDPLIKKERGLDRPMYEFNKLRVTVKRIVNDIRQNRPMGKVRATEDGDVETAEVLEGLIRNIWANADGDTVIDAAAEYQVGAGMGAWRITLDYADDEAFDQVIGVDPIRNPFCLYADPGCNDLLKRDANDWILTDKISKEQFKQRYPKAEAISFEASEFDGNDDWETDDWVRIVEYWYKMPVDKTIALLSSGQTVDLATVPQLPPDVSIVKQRKVRGHKIMMCIAGGGDKLLEGPVEWAGSQFPFVIVYGEHLVVDGKTTWFGLTRFGKDAQRSYNYSRTNAIESVALAPQAKIWATPEQAVGHTEEWAEAHRKNFPYMLYNADPKASGPPVRVGGADVPVALIQEMQAASEDIKAVTGIYDASLGNRGNETSGRAINARQQQGEIVTFNYMDNMGKGIRRTWEILVDLVPKVIDTARSVRILGSDGAEDYAKVNHPGVDPKTGMPTVINDLARGKYDVAITVGPSWSTRRQEAAEIYTQLGQQNPQLFAIAGDLIMKATDAPYADDIAKRIKAMLPPQIQALESQGKEIPPEAQAAMQQAQQMMQQVEQHGQLVQQAAAEAEKEKALSEKAKNDVQLALANLDVKRAQFDADVAKSLAQISLAQAKQMTDQGGQAVQQDREALASQVTQAVAEMQAMYSAHMQAQAQALSQIQQAAQQQQPVIVPNRPRIIGIQTQRDPKGNLMAIPTYEDQVAQ